MGCSVPTCDFKTINLPPLNQHPQRQPHVPRLSNDPRMMLVFQLRTGTSLFGDGMSFALGQASTMQLRPPTYSSVRALNSATTFKDQTRRHLRQPVTVTGNYALSGSDPSGNWSLTHRTPPAQTRARRTIPLLCSKSERQSRNV